MELGAVGSPVDAATFVAVLALYRYEARQDLDTLAAGVVALARGDRSVDADVLAADLEVDERDVDAVRPTIVDGGEEGDRAHA